MLSIGYEKVLLMYTPSNSGVSDIIDTLVYRTGLQNQNYSYACLLYTSPLAALTFAASSIICAFGLASAAPRSPYRHLELCLSLIHIWPP